MQPPIPGLHLGTDLNLQQGINSCSNCSEERSNGHGTLRSSTSLCARRCTVGGVGGIGGRVNVGELVSYCLVLAGVAGQDGGTGTEHDVGAVVEGSAAAGRGDDLDGSRGAVCDVEGLQFGGARLGQAGDAGAGAVVDAGQGDVEACDSVAETQVHPHESFGVGRVEDHGAAIKRPLGAVL
jgi:hypothetical protein